MRDNVIVIIPAYNEAQNLLSVISNLQAAEFNFCVINDGSTDNTVDLLEKKAINHISHDVNKGQGSALTTGFKYALEKGYKYVVHFDADGQHQVQDISSVVSPVLRGSADIVFGTRFLSRKSRREIPFFKRNILRIARVFEGARTGIWLSDAHCGIRALDVESCKKMHIKSTGMAHASEYVSETKRLKLRYEEVPVFVTYEKKSNQNILKRIIVVISELIKN